MIDFYFLIPILLICLVYFFWLKWSRFIDKLDIKYISKEENRYLKTPRLVYVVTALTVLVLGRW